MEKALDVDRSRELAQASGSKAKAPFDNAYAAIQAMPEAEYVQGFLAFPGAPFAPIEHAWLETADNILDPTFPSLQKKAENLYYFAAQRLDWQALQAAIEEAEEDYPEDEPLPIYGSTPYDYYGDVMLGGQEYTAAFEAAKAKCRELNPDKLPSGKDRPQPKQPPSHANNEAG
jgi:hypothetical protein